VARAKALSAIRAQVRKRADCVGDTTTGRHTNADINQMINDSWQAMREMMADKGHYLKAAVATMTAGATSPYQFGTISMPADCVRVMGIDVRISTQEVRTLLPVMFLERNEFFGTYGQVVGMPEGFHVFNVGTEVTTTVTPGTIGIFPAPDQAYSYTLWYVPSWTDVTNDTYLFDGLAGWDEWVIADVVLKIASGDNDMAQTAAIEAQLQAAAKERLMRSVESIQSVGPARRIDVQALRARNSRNTHTRWP
jgi:hypothetical protein